MDSNSPSAIDRQLLDAFVDLLVPKDADPGLVEAGMSEQLLEWSEDKLEEAKRAAAMLPVIERVTEKKFSLAFSCLVLAPARVGA